MPMTKEQIRQHDFATARGLATARTVLDHCRQAVHYQGMGDAALAGIYQECAERALLDAGESL